MFVMCRVDMEDGGRGVEEGNRILNSAEVGARLISNLISIPIVMVYLCMCCVQLSAIAYPGQPQNSPSTPAALAPPGRCSRSVFDYFTDPSKIVHSSKWHVWSKEVGLIPSTSNRISNPMVMVPLYVIWCRGGIGVKSWEGLVWSNPYLILYPTLWLWCTLVWDMV